MEDKSNKLLGVVGIEFGRTDAETHYLMDRLGRRSDGGAAAIDGFAQSIGCGHIAGGA